MADALQTVLTQAGLALAPLRSVKTSNDAVAFFLETRLRDSSRSIWRRANRTVNHGKRSDQCRAPAHPGDQRGGYSSAIVNLFTRIVAAVDAVKQLHTQIKSGGGGGLPNIDDSP